MSYEDKHQIRQKLIELSKEIDPKVKIDTSKYTIYVDLRSRKWSYLDIIDATRKVVSFIVEIPGMKEATTEEGEFSFQFCGHGAEITVNSGREGVGIFLCESED